LTSVKIGHVTFKAQFKLWKIGKLNSDSCKNLICKIHVTWRW